MAATLGLDIGTTSIKAIVFETKTGLITRSASLPTPVSRPTRSRFEHDPEQLWQTVTTVTRQAAKGLDIKAVAISSFAEAGLPLDSGLKPLYPIIAWYDQRTQYLLEDLQQQISEGEIFSITGQKSGFSFGLLKILWLRKYEKTIFKQMAKWMSVPDYIVYKLCGQSVTDYTQAARTLLFDQLDRTWSPRMLEIAGLTPDMLPTIHPSGTALGKISRLAAEQTGLGTDTICVLGGHDHLCGAFACGGSSHDGWLDSMGTSQAVIAITEHFSPTEEMLEKGFVHYAHVVPNTYLVKGGMKAAGKALDWSREIFGDPLHDYGAKALQDYSADLPLWLPFFQGSGTPYRKPSARAVLYGLHAHHSRAEITLALLEGFAFWLRSNIEEIARITNHQPKNIIAFGGVNQNKLILQLKASTLNIPIISPTMPEASAMGAALLAAIGTGIVKSFQDAENFLNYTPEVIHPNKNIAGILRKRYHEGYLPLRNALSNK